MFICTAKDIILCSLLDSNTLIEPVEYVNKEIDTHAWLLGKLFYSQPEKIDYLQMISTLS